jgi:2-desacetyl-2-hydroxyethyl bacteriochlorophyllide A dehydrogenase
MEALVVDAPGQFAVRTLSDPVPGPFQVLTRQRFGAICAATDRHLVAGELPIPGIRYPLILGHESIGEVVEVGSQVRNLKPGDLVTRTGAPETDGVAATWGGFATLGLATDWEAMREAGHGEAEWAPHAINRVLPTGFDPAASTMMITWRETCSYLLRLGVREGSRVLVLGSGGNGFSFACLARALGAQRVAMVGNPHWASLAARAGVDEFADYHDLPLRLSGRFDILVDAVGQTGGVETALPLLAENASVGIYGIEALGERMAFLKGLADAGVRAHGPGDYSEAEAHDRVVDLVERGALDARFWFDPGKAVPLEAIGDAFQSTSRRESLKAVIRLA